jgi:hypothetical protein
MVATLIAFSLVNCISQGKEKDFPIIWEIFLELGNLKVRYGRIQL